MLILSLCVFFVYDTISFRLNTLIFKNLGGFGYKIGFSLYFREVKHNLIIFIIGKNKQKIEEKWEFLRKSNFLTKSMFYLCNSKTIKTKIHRHRFFLYAFQIRLTIISTNRFSYTMMYYIIQI